MAESRRVQLTTLSCGVASFSSDTSDPVRQGCPGVLQDNGTGSGRPSVTETMRLVITLFEPDRRRFPEFNYCELIENKQTEDVPLSQLDLEEKGEHDEAAAIARTLEEKYDDKRKRKDRIQDLVDIGYGYDEDSFIDNSEAYDEFVPSFLTTKFGGFYVNSGVLHFRQISDTDTDDFSTEEGIIEPTKKRKFDGEQDKPKKRRGEMKSNTKLSTVSKTRVNDVKIKKKKAAKMLSVTSMLKRFQREKEKERQNMEKANQMMEATTASPFPTDAAGGGSGLTDRLLSLIGSTNDHALIQAASTVDFDIDLDSLLEVSEENLSPKSLPQAAAEMQLIKPGSGLQVQQNIQSEAESQPLTAKANVLPKPQSDQLQFLAEPSPVVRSLSTSLPEGLPPGLVDSIGDLVMAAKTSEGESKVKFFSSDINSILLDIELQCQEQSSQLRSKVYKHLSSFMPCSKDTLLKRVKKLLITHEEEPTAEDQLQKLKKAIERSMPEQMACFQESCQAYAQAKTSKETEEENLEEKSVRKGVPKKVFKWNQEIRNCLDLLLKEKMEKCQKEGKYGQELEEYLKTVLDNEVKPLWPKGWMQSRVLRKESRKLSGLFSSLQLNKAKGFQTEKGHSSVGGASKSTDGCSSLQGTEELKVESSIFVLSPSTADKPPANPTSAPERSLLDILADQALAREHPLDLSRGYMATAIFKPWSFGSMDDRSPPLPPPPPNSSPINFPESQVVLPQLLQVGDMRSLAAPQLRNGQ
ncbi:ubinuclein-1-like isoform X2 [Girardinichthys multiradiatus]|uniref:ubinuclein-1-like isoform X2 n=1 Tax=Girardinichthys multiradiatus TaxID=208333 RepID=UPI001FACE902|nr:ubinuclein-1-like isoform X2 [Girardinichthys multiradiatus]